MEEEVYFSAPQSPEFNRTADGKLEISGWSVHTGKFQGDTVEIPASELRNIAETLVNRKILRDHWVETSRSVGKITETKVSLDKNERKKGVKYKAVIRDEEMEQKITDGFLDNMSIGFTLFPECSKCGEDFRYCRHWFDEAHVIAKDIECHEQSIVVVGADQKTTIEPGASFAMNNDFKAQFDYKQPNKDAFKESIQNIVLGAIKDIPKETWTTGSTSITQTNDGTTVPPDTSFNEGNGDKMEKLQEKYDALLTENGQLKETINTRDATISELEDKNAGLITEMSDKDTKIGELESTNKTLSDENEAFKTIAEEAKLEAQKKEIEELAKEELDKNMIKEAELAAEIERLSKMDEAGLAATKTIVARTQKVEKEPKIGEFNDNADKGNMSESQEGSQELDFEKMAQDPKWREALLDRILKNATSVGE